MTCTSKEKGGSFKGMRTRDLRLFDPALRRHDRGWPHALPEPGKEQSPKRPWKTVGIFHFRHDEDEKG